MSAPSKQHLHTLDSLRGIAALSVCLFHFTGVVLPKVHYGPAQSLFSWGWLGVEIFFVISGFIIPYVLLRDNYRITQYGTFIGKRFVRICPPSWIIIGLTLLQYFMIDRFLHPPKSWMGAISWVQLLDNLFYLIPFTHFQWINSVFWTLAIEFQFYLFVGLVFPLMYRNVPAFIGGSLVVAAAWFLPLSGPIQFFHYSSLFLMGGAVLLHRERRIGTPGYGALLAGLTVVAWLQLGIPAAAFGLATSLLISFVPVRNAAGAFLGKISYSLYLVHILVGSSLEVVLVRVIPPVSPLHRLAVMLLCLAGTIGAAWIYYRVVEVYFMNLAHRLFDRRKARRKAVLPGVEAPPL